MIPTREALRATYDAVVGEIDSARGSRQLTNPFYTKIGDAIFDACYCALENSEASKEGVKLPPRIHVVSAPMGTGKTSFTLAFITSLVLLAHIVGDALASPVVTVAVLSERSHPQQASVYAVVYSGRFRSARDCK